MKANDKLTKIYSCISKRINYIRMPNAVIYITEKMILNCHSAQKIRKKVKNIDVPEKIQFA